MPEPKESVVATKFDQNLSVKERPEGKVVRAIKFAALTKMKAAELVARAATKGLPKPSKEAADRLRDAIVAVQSAERRQREEERRQSDEDAKRREERMEARGSNADLLSWIPKMREFVFSEPSPEYRKAVVELGVELERFHKELGGLAPMEALSARAEQIGTALAEAETAKSTALSKDGKTLFVASRKAAIRLGRSEAGWKLRVASDDAEVGVEDAVASSEGIFGTRIRFFMSSSQFDKTLALLGGGAAPAFDSNASGYVMTEFVSQEALHSALNSLDENPLAAAATAASAVVPRLKGKSFASESRPFTARLNRLAGYLEAWKAAAEAVGEAASLAEMSGTGKVVKAFLANAMPAGAYESLAKVWPDAKEIPMREFERFANAKETAAAMLAQNENLAIFALRAARGLGLDEMGENLFGETKAELAKMGLTQGGWKMLSKLDPEASKRTLLSFSSDDSQAIKEHERFHLNLIMGGSFSEAFSRIEALDGEENKDLFDEEVVQARISAQLKEKADRIAEANKKAVKDDLRLLCKAVSACAKNGLDPEPAAEFLAALRSPGHMKDLLLFGEDYFLNEHSRARREEYLGQTPEAREAEVARKLSVSERLLDQFAAAAKRFGVKKACADLSGIGDFILGSEWGVFERLDRGLDWDGFKAESRRWHEMVEMREADGRAKIAWESPLPGLKDVAKGFEAIALVDGQKLYEEGKAMRHCVSSYASRCESGSSAIFSILQDGARLATLELRQGESGKWENAQFLGRCNKAIESKEACKFADQVAQEYGLAHRAKAALKNAEEDARVEASLREAGITIPARRPK